MDSLGSRIAMARKKTGLTQQQAAEKIGLKHYKSFSNYELGVTEPDIETLVWLSKASGYSLGYIVLGYDEVKGDKVLDWDVFEESIAEICELFENSKKKQSLEFMIKSCGALYEEKVRDMLEQSNITQSKSA